MTEESFKRKLTAILSADVEGYSRLMGEDAIAACKKTVKLCPNVLTIYIVLTVAYSSEGRMEEARSAASKIMKIQPNFSIKHYAKILPYKNEADRDLLVSAHLKMRQFVQCQGMRKFQPQEYKDIFRGLKFEHDVEIGQKGHLWMGTA